MTKNYYLDAGNEEEKLGKLVTILNKNDFKEARRFADILLGQGIPKTTINHTCYDTFNRINSENYGKGAELARAFVEYQWDSWLSK